MKKRWWNRPSYLVMMISFFIACTGALLFCMGALHIAVLYLWRGGPEPTFWQWVLLYICLTVVLWLSFIIHRYDRILSPKWIRRLRNKG